VIEKVLDPELDAREASPAQAGEASLFLDLDGHVL